MVYSTRRFVSCFTLCYFVLVFFLVLFSIAITSPEEERANLSAFSYVCSICACLVLSVSSSSWCLGRAAVCDCGTPWTFLLSFVFYYFCHCMSLHVIFFILDSRLATFWERNCPFCFLLKVF